MLNILEEQYLEQVYNNNINPDKHYKSNDIEFKRLQETFLSLEANIIKVLDDKTKKDFEQFTMSYIEIYDHKLAGAYAQGFSDGLLTMLEIANRMKESNN